MNYDTQVSFDPNLIDVWYTDIDNPLVKGLIKSGVYIATGTPVATPKVFMPGAIIENAVDGTAYIMDGTTASPHWTKLEASTVVLTKNNMTAVTTPGSGNDNTQGYSIGSLWFDTVTSVLWIARTVGTGTATWEQVLVGQGKNNPLAVLAPTVAADNTLGYAIGSMWFDTITNAMYIATSVATGAAVWVAISSTGAGLFSAQVSLTSAQIKALNGTPIPLATAVGFGLSSSQAFVPIKGSMAYTFLTLAYAANTTLQIIHAGSAKPSLQTDFSQGSSTFTFFNDPTSATPAAGNQYIANADLNVFVPTGNPTTGSGTMKVTCLFSIQSLI